MGQYANQPDFITNDIQPVAPVAVASLTAADSLNGSVLYIGTSAPGNLQVIPAGRVGPSTATELVSPGYAGSGGTGYVSDEYQTSGGSGTGLDVNITAVNGVVVSVDAIVGGEDSGYLNGELVTIDATGSGNPGDDNAVFRVVASPGLPGAAQAQVFVNVPQGEWFPVVVDYVLSDSTTVSDIIAGK